MNYCKIRQKQTESLVRNKHNNLKDEENILSQLEREILHSKELGLERKFTSYNHLVKSLSLPEEFQQEELGLNTTKQIFDSLNLGNKPIVSFIGNDYFALSGNKNIIATAQKVIGEAGFGAGSSIFLGGMHQYYQQFIAKLTKFKKCQAGLVFPSGYQAVIGVISALCNEKDLIIADKFIHQSHIAGAKLSGAKFLRFKHNDINHCQSLLANYRKEFRRCFIVSETIFSMDGDCGNIAELWDLAQKYSANLIVDDAHGLGLVDYSGFFSQSNGNSQYLQIGTMSKALASIGGYVVGSELIIEYLQNFAKSAIYTTALPASALAVATIALTKIAEDGELINNAINNKKLFCQIISDYANKILEQDEMPLDRANSNDINKLRLEKIVAEILIAKEQRSLIVPIIIGENQKVLKIARKVAENGFLIGAIRPPTVPPSTARLRITFNSQISKKSIDTLAKLLVELIINFD
jgi:8-amino-7-oxononanoate synthase